MYTFRSVLCFEAHSLLCCCRFQKQFEGQHSFEQKLHLMLQRIGVSKAQPGETQVGERACLNLHMYTVMVFEKCLNTYFALLESGGRNEKSRI